MSDRPFVGRDGEVSELLRALEDASGGTGRVVLVGGPPGIGKTRLVDQLAGRAAGRGAAVLWGRSWEGGGAPAYWPWAEALRSLVHDRDPGVVRRGLGDAAGPLIALLPDVGTHPSPRLPELDAPSESARFRLFQGITSFLTEAASERPVVLVLEDLHAADIPSLLLLRFVARSLADRRILVVGTYRDIALDEEASTMLADVARERVARRITLTGLGAEEVRAVIDHAAGAPASDALVDAVHRHTDGNPLFLNEVIRHLAATEAGADHGAGPLVALPRHLRRAIADGLRRVSPPCRTLLSVAAVAGREFRLPVLGAVGVVAEKDVAELADEAIAAGIVEEVPDRPGVMRFSHALVGEAVYEDLPHARRAHLHGRIGEVLEEMDPVDPAERAAELAHHFVRAGSAGVAEKAVRYAREAGDRALRLLAYEEGVRLYEMALRGAQQGGTEADRRDLLLSLGEALARSGDQDNARRVFLQAAEVAGGTGSAEALARAALGYGGRFVWARAAGDRHVRRLLERALEALPGEDSALRARVMARLAGVLRDDPAREPRWSISAEAVAVARRLGDASTLAYALESRFTAIWEPATAAERLGIADELTALADVADDPERALQAHGLRLHALFEHGDLDGVRAEHRTEQRLVETVPQPAQRWIVAAGSAALALFEGRFRDAEKLIPRALEHGRRAQNADAEVSYRLQTYLLRRDTGGAESLEPLLRASVDDFPWYSMFSSVLADLYARIGRPDEAGEILDSLASDRFAAIPVDSQWLFSMTMLADAASAVGHTASAAVLYDLLSPWADLAGYSPPEASTGSVGRSVGVLAAALSRWDEAIRHLEHAVTANRAMGARPWLARTYAAYASALLARGDPADRGRADAFATEAEAIRDRLGMDSVGPPTADRGERGIGRSAPEPVAGTSARRVAGVFRREGDTWSIAFDGRTFRLSDSKGLRYLAGLLGNPGREILALDLAAGGGERPGPRPVSEEGLSPVGAERGDVLDAAARSAYRRRLDELREELEESEAWSDVERAARAREEMEFIAAELAAASGLGGRGRKMGSPAERARQSVTKALKLAIERIAREDPALGRHLAATVRTGTFCSYTPDPRLDAVWRT